MTLVGLIVALIVVGLALYVVWLLPIDATVKKIIYAIVLVAVVLWLLDAFFGFGDLHIGRIRTR